MASLSTTSFISSIESSAKIIRNNDSSSVKENTDSTKQYNEALSTRFNNSLSTRESNSFKLEKSIEGTYETEEVLLESMEETQKQASIALFHDYWRWKRDVEKKEKEIWQQWEEIKDPEEAKEMKKEVEGDIARTKRNFMRNWFHDLWMVYCDPTIPGQEYGLTKKCFIMMLSDVIFTWSQQTIKRKINCSRETLKCYKSTCKKWQKAMKSENENNILYKTALNIWKNLSGDEETLPKEKVFKLEDTFSQVQSGYQQFVESLLTNINKKRKKKMRARTGPMRLKSY